MLEGLWTVRFQNQLIDDQSLNGGVVVIESGRILGGDSGYAYIGDIAPAGSGQWHATVGITRHDPQI
jgi:hypothetical protein